MDYMKQIEDIMEEKQDVSQRLVSSWDNQDLFYRAKQCLSMGYKVYCLYTLDGKTHEGELVDSWQWSSEKVNVLRTDGTVIRIPMDDVSCVKC